MNTNMTKTCGSLGENIDNETLKTENIEDETLTSENIKVETLESAKKLKLRHRKVET